MSRNGSVSTIYLGFIRMRVQRTSFTRFLENEANCEWPLFMGLSESFYEEPIFCINCSHLLRRASGTLSCASAYMPIVSVLYFYVLFWSSEPGTFNSSTMLRFTLSSQMMKIACWGMQTSAMLFDTACALDD